MPTMPHRIFPSLLVALAGLAIALASCNTHPVDYERAAGAVEHVEPVSGGGGTTLDILWVIDNSLSMCQEQEALRANFRQFINTLDQTPVDFHVAVTTTHFQGAFEEVAEPGKIQSLPHPPVSFSPECKFDGEDKKGKRDYTPLVNQIDAALSCVDDPESLDDINLLRQWADDNITPQDKEWFRCALFDDEPAPGKSDQMSVCQDLGVSDSFSKEQLFPCGNKFGQTCDRGKLSQVYRKIPKILEAKNYRTEQGLEKKRLRRDFACMSYVGTRGSSNEQGLRAASRAVAPFMTGGPVSQPFKNKSFEDPLKNGNDKSVEVKDGTNSPNHGLLRQDSKTAVLFITDEDDCSHTGTKILDRRQGNSCGELNCYAPTLRKDDGILTKTQNLWDRFKTNLKKSKRIDGDLPAGEIIVGSIHAYRQGVENLTPKKCSEFTISDFQACSTNRGSARHGSRYANFLTLAQTDDQTAVPEDPSKGFMCRQGLSRPLEIIADKLNQQTQSCISNRVVPCDTSCTTDSEKDCSCPGFEYSEQSGAVCKKWADGKSSPDGYCASAIRLRMSPSGDRKVSDLDSSFQQTFRDVCVKKSREDGSEDRCIVKRSYYSWDPCPGNPSDAVTLDWDTSKISNPRRALAPFVVEARYTEESVSSTSGGGGGSGSDAMSTE